MIAEIATAVAHAAQANARDIEAGAAELGVFHRVSEPVRASCEVRHDIRRKEFVSLDVVPVIAVDQQVHTGVLILADQIDGLGHRADKTAQRSALSQPLTLRRHSGLVAAEQPAVIVGRFDRGAVTLRGVAMPTKHRELVPHRFRITTDVAGIGQASDPCITWWARQRGA